MFAAWTISGSSSSPHVPSSAPSPPLPATCGRRAWTVPSSALNAAASPASPS